MEFQLYARDSSDKQLIIQTNESVELQTKRKLATVSFKAKVSSSNTKQPYILSTITNYLLTTIYL